MAPSPPTAHITEAELAVLQVLWDNGPSTIRQITDRIYPGGGTSEYATVQKLLERLEGKSAVTRDRSHPAHRFAAALTHADVMDQNLRTVAEKLCDGSLTPLLMHLVQNTKLSKADRDVLREMIRKHEPPAKGSGK